MREIFQDLINKITSKSCIFSQIQKKIDTSKVLYLTGLSYPARSLFISYLINSINRPVLVITPDITTALRYSQDIHYLTEKDIPYFPSQEASPYELVYSNSAVIKEQMKLLHSFKNGNIRYMAITAKSLLNTYLSQINTEKYSANLTKGKKADPEETARNLIDLGYRRNNVVLDPGDFSLRGDILDVYPISEDPVRIEFFADEIENIRNFDVNTQRSIKHIQSIKIEPRYKTVIKEDSKQAFIDKLLDIKKLQEKKLSDISKETLSVTVDNLITSFENETYFEGIEYFAPLIDEKMDDIFDYLPDNTLIIAHESIETEHKLDIYDDKYNTEYENNINEGLSLSLPSMQHRDSNYINSKLNKYSALNLDSFIQEEEQYSEIIECSLIPKFLANLDNAASYISDLRSDNYNIFIITEYPQRLESILSEWECSSVNIDSTSVPNIENLINSKEIIISRQGFSEGFILPQLKLAVITDTELFNRKIKKPTIGKITSKKESLDFLVSLNDLHEGDYVVHANHGIGKFIGISKQNIDGQEKDYLTIEYAKNDKLHMPADQINMLSRFRGSGTPPKLTRMGGVEWTGVKTKVKKAITNIAQDLLNLYAQRAKTEGFIYESDSPWQLEMEDAFTYTETPDQLRSINETKTDMESSKPMDRLICGDVGFGKTEIAIRAAFKAILSGKQVAMLVPTTILAQQHYQTFSDRFKPYPVKIGLLSRFRTPKQQKETIKDIITGECDFVIGTHRILQKDIRFKNLGLLIIDEEHKFGVAHKEKLKMLKAQIDVLTLSATPIPRTLYMSLTGVRDMSLINTPPVNRAPIKTYMGSYNTSLVRTAIKHEMEREGQIYFVHNRVQSIYKSAKDLQDLIPEARIAVGHGQMNEKELEKIMYEFSTYQHDVLVCTTIIESGLDIPNVNTIIIDDADRFGLAQLYQMRGRVGRTETQAYAYCLYRPNKLLTEEAKDRLKAIKDFNVLGSGYQIALRDLEIRGVGNILGAEQHGQMLAVGFDMYCNLLEESVQELQGIKPQKAEPPVVDINITAYIPDEWLGDKEQKMLEYKRLADVQSIEELKLIEDEWKDRFGNIPDVVKRLFKIIKIRLTATNIGINMVREAEGCIRISTDYDMIEWKKYQSRLPRETARRIRWTKAPVSFTSGVSILILNNTGLLPEEQLNILEELFYNISTIRNT
ncbi:MAG: transcription-repair coupling factor [Candidatus Gastranaerophilales bacterium]|nr:transcription-repair coupling factor [Candidatus Gastranaerophilales bacterium]